MLSNSLLRHSVLAFALLGATISARADIKMPLIFGDHMVLQQGAKLPVWGWADAGEKVTVTFAGQSVSISAASDGSWRVDLPSQTVSDQGQVLTIAGKNSISFKDVLVGDVWVCSGQSNMEYGIRKKLYADDVAKAADPQLRLFFVPKTTALDPKKDITLDPTAAGAALSAKWVLCTPDALNQINGQGFATAAYYFAREIRQNRKNPLGMIESSWGGTRAEAWTSISGLQKDPALAHYLAIHQKLVADYPAELVTYPKKKADFDAAIKVWNEEVGKAWDKEQDAWKAAVIQAQAAGQPAPAKPTPSRPRPNNISPPDGGSSGPGNLFNAMISPLMPFSIKGVIWYQGEFNSGYDSGREYATLFPRMITDWREKWGQGDFPFIFVQLPNFGIPATEPSQEDNGWCWVREGQLKALSLPNTGMASAIDIGDPFQLHPPDKPDVGHRLALAARHVAYGDDIVFSGPIYKSMSVEGSKIRVTFTNTGSGLVIGTSPYTCPQIPPKTITKLVGFGIAGADQKFVWADAVIDGDSVVVSSDKISSPVAVRYDFADCPSGNLYNREGLPASPFRTDSWDR